MVAEAILGTFDWPNTGTDAGFSLVVGVGTSRTPASGLEKTKGPAQDHRAQSETVHTEGGHFRPYGYLSEPVSARTGVTNFS